MTSPELWTALPAPAPPRARSGRWIGYPAVLTPVALIGGWTVAAALWPGYSSLSSTISALAATNAPHRWIMTLGFVVTGSCLLLIAAGLRPARWLGRLVLAGAGVAVLTIAAQPLPDHGQVHSAAAFVAFTALACWPVLAATRTGPRLLSPAWAVPVSAVGLMLVVLLERYPSLGGAGGLLERVLAGAEVLWVCAGTLACRRPAWR